MYQTLKKAQPRALRIIENSIKNNRMSHAYLFVGGLNGKYAWEFIASAMEQFNALYLNPTQEQADILEAWLNNQNDMIIYNQHSS